MFSGWIPFPLVHRFTIDTKSSSTFLLVGLPAHEVENPLIYPLSGHELGHSLWPQVKNNLSPILTEKIESLIRTDERFKNSWEETFKVKEDIQHNMWSSIPQGHTAEWALRQTEEIFCDLVGLQIFGDAYLHSFRYAVAGHGMTSPVYPSYKTRYEILCSSWRKMEPLNSEQPRIDFIPTRKNGQFSDVVSRLQWDIANAATESIQNEIEEQAVKICTEKNLNSWISLDWKDESDRGAS
jgi:hypothetical protein